MKTRYDITEEGIVPMSFPLIFKGDIVITDTIYFSDNLEFDLSVFSKYILFNTDRMAECFVINSDLEKKELKSAKEIIDEDVFTIGSFTVISQTVGIFYLNEVQSLTDIKDNPIVVIEKFNGTVKRIPTGLIGNGNVNFYLELQ
jgi:hypothetical protein